MVQKFLKNGLLLVLINLLIKPYWLFGIDRVVQNRLPEEYGLYFALFNFTFLFNMVLDLGINNYNTRTIAQDEEKYKGHVSLILPLKLILFLVYLVLTAVLGLVLDYNKASFLLIALLCVNQGFSSLLAYLRSNLTGLHYYRTDSIISGVDKLLMILLCLPLLYGKTELKISHFIMAQGFAYFLTAAVVLGILLRRKGWFLIKPDPEKWISILKKAFPYALLGLLMSIYVRVDAVMLERMLPDGRIESGIYAEGFRLLDALVSFLALMAALLLPMFSKLISDKGNYIPLRTVSSVLALAVCICISVLSWMWSNEIVDALYPNRNPYHFEVFEMIMWSLIPLCGIYVYGTFLTAAGELRYLNQIAAVAVLINISLNLLLIPELKAFGSAVATLITQSLVFAAHYYLCMRKYRLTT